MATGKPFDRAKLQNSTIEEADRFAIAREAIIRSIAPIELTRGAFDS
jgi:hypothetical protein